MKYILVFLSTLIFHFTAKTQIIRDSFLIAAIYRIDSVKNGYNYYTVRTGNISTTPLTILYSIRQLLTISTETRLAVWDSTRSTEEYYLAYAAGDQVHDHWLPEMADNPFILLPYQFIDFSIAVPVSGRKQFLNFDYVIVPDLCYPEIRRKYLSGSGWSRPYRRFKKRMQIN